LKVVADGPELAHGETAEKPIPTPNATKASVKAAAAMAPAATAAHDTAETDVSSVYVPSPTRCSLIIGLAGPEYHHLSPPQR
jgi:hypothetical protein